MGVDINDARQNSPGLFLFCFFDRLRINRAYTISIQDQTPLDDPLFSYDLNFLIRSTSFLSSLTSL